MCLRFTAYAVNLRVINSFLRKLICTRLQLIRVQSAPELNAPLKQMAVLLSHTPAFLPRLSQTAEPRESELTHMLAC